MIKVILINLLIIPLLGFMSTFQQMAGLYIDEPASGATVQGVVEIRGSIPTEKFVSAELAYAYNNSSTTTWFLMTRIAEPVHNQVIARWDTTAITDGKYSLRLLVLKENGKFDTVQVDEIQVSNYIRQEGPQELWTEENTPQFVVTKTQLPGPTRLPVNPVALTHRQLINSIEIGVIVAVIMIFALLLYHLIKRDHSKR